MPSRKAAQIIRKNIGLGPHRAYIPGRRGLLLNEDSAVVIMANRLRLLRRPGAAGTV
jgi:hypothetical protein